MDSRQEALQRRLGYRFVESGLLSRALTHRSFGAEHNERLEFLGDAVLNVAVSSLLYERFSGSDEGDLTRVRAHLVREDSLHRVALMLGLPEVVRLSEGETRGGGSTHAWCAVYLPGAGWVEYDPTNGLVAGDHLVRITVTRTPEQAVPIGGGFLGNPQDFAGMRVEVLVRAGHELPPDPLPPLPEPCGLTMPILR